MTVIAAYKPRDLDDLLAYLHTNFSHLSPQLQNAARYLLDYPQEIPLCSMRKVAANAGVQPATLVRIAQHLGYDGWQGIREIFTNALRSHPQPYAKRARKIVQESGTNRMLEEIARAQHQNIDFMLAASAKNLEHAADLLTAAPKVYIAGFRACFPIAFTLHYVYRLFRDSVILVRGDAGTLEMELRSLTAKDAVFIIGFAPYSRESVQVAQAAHARGSRVIALTDSSVAPIALKADCTLLFSAESPSFFPSITSGIAIAEVLAERLLAKQGKRALKRLEASESQLHQSGAYVKNQKL